MVLYIGVSDESEKTAVIKDDMMIFPRFLRMPDSSSWRCSYQIVLNVGTTSRVRFAVCDGADPLTGQYEETYCRDIYIKTGLIING